MNGNDDRFPEIMDDLPPVEVSRDMVFRCPENNAAIAYWRSKRGIRKIPARADIDPVEMRAFLPHVGLLETPDGTPARPDYRVALAGGVELMVQTMPSQRFAPGDAVAISARDEDFVVLDGAARA